MMWNLLVGGLLDRGRDRALRRQPRLPRPRRALGPAPTARITLLRDERRLHRRLHEGRGSSRRRGPRSVARCAAVGSTGSPLSPRGLPLGLRRRSARDTWLFSMSGRHRRLHRVRRRRPDAAGLRGELQARALGATSRPGTRTGAPLIGEVGELVITEPMPSMPVYFWGDDDGSRYRESYFDDVPGRLAPRRLDRDHRARHGDHLRPLGLDDQPRRRPDRHRARSTARCSALPDSSTRSSSTCRARAPTAGSPSSSCCGRRARLDETLRAGIAARLRDDCSPRHVPDEVRADRRGAADAVGQALEVPMKRILLGADPAHAVSADALANPAAVDIFVRLAAERRVAAETPASVQTSLRGDLKQRGG